MKKIFAILLCAAALSPAAAQAPKDLKPIAAMTQQLWDDTGCRNLNEQRMEILTDLQYYFDRANDFGKYLACTDSAEEKAMEDNTVWSFYHDAIDRLLQEIPNEKVTYGNIAVWQLYNMGYVIKTPTHCFGIDLCHKYADKLEPYIEFLCITHPHPDHYNDKLTKAMADAGKPVYSGYINNGYMLPEEMTTFNPVDDIEITTKRVRHSKNDKIVTYYQIDCGRNTRNKVVFHAGDAFDYTELEKTKEIDIFIPHTTVGLFIDRAAKKLNPTYTLMSHVYEMGHPAKYPGSGFYRIPYVDAIRKGWFIGTGQGLVPVWGEKMIF